MILLANKPSRSPAVAAQDVPIPSKSYDIIKCEKSGVYSRLQTAIIRLCVAGANSAGGSFMASLLRMFLHNDHF